MVMLAVSTINRDTSFSSGILERCKQKNGKITLRGLHRSFDLLPKVLVNRIVYTGVTEGSSPCFDFRPGEP